MPGLIADIPVTNTLFAIRLRQHHTLSVKGTVGPLLMI